MRITLAAASLTLLVGACSEGSDGRFFIVQNQVPSANCMAGTARGTYQGEGVIDAALVGARGFAYVLAPLLQNDYPSTGGGMPQPNRMFVRAFRVRVEAGAGAPPRVIELLDKLAASEATRSLLEYQEPWAATIEPGGGLLGAFVGVVPGELARQVRNTRVLEAGQEVPLIVRVRAVGERRDDEVESQEFVYPIKMCEGCLIANLQQCPYTPINVGNPCNVAQDNLVDCCQDGTELNCPATRPATTTTK